MGLFSRTAAAVAAACAMTSVASAGTVIFNEGDFLPGSWSEAAPVWSLPAQPGLFGSAMTSRFEQGAPADGFLITQFVLDVPAASFNALNAPVLFDGWTHDPQTQGAIESVAASMRTLPVAGAQLSVAVARIYIQQDGKLFHANIAGLSFDEPEAVRNVSGLVATDFFELHPAKGTLLDSHPDFSGSEMAFGMGIQLTSTGFSGAGQTTRLIGWDDASVRLQIVPTPGAATLLAAGGLMLVRRRR